MDVSCVLVAFTDRSNFSWTWNLWLVLFLNALSLCLLDFIQRLHLRDISIIKIKWNLYCNCRTKVGHKINQILLYVSELLFKMILTICIFTLSGETPMTSLEWSYGIRRNKWKKDLNVWNKVLFVCILILMVHTFRKVILISTCCSLFTVQWIFLYQSIYFERFFL